MIYSKVKVKEKFAERRTNLEHQCLITLGNERASYVNETLQKLLRDTNSGAEVRSGESQMKAGEST